MRRRQTSQIALEDTGDDEQDDESSEGHFLLSMSKFHKVCTIFSLAASTSTMPTTNTQIYCNRGRRMSLQPSTCYLMMMAVRQKRRLSKVESC